MSDENLPAHPPGYWFMNMVGIDRFEADGDAVRVSLEVTPRHHNPNGVAHGGVLSTLADTAMGLAARLAMGENERPSTVDMSIRYFRPLISGRVTCTSRVVNRGRNFIILVADIVNDEEKLVGHATANFYINRSETLPVISDPGTVEEQRIRLEALREGLGGGTDGR